MLSVIKKYLPYSGWLVVPLICFSLFGQHIAPKTWNDWFGKDDPNYVPPAMHHYALYAIDDFGDASLDTKKLLGIYPNKNLCLRSESSASEFVGAMYTGLKCTDVEDKYQAELEARRHDKNAPVMSEKDNFENSNSVFDTP